MSTVLSPVGPQPPQVYWVRRLVVLLALVVVVAVVWALVARGAGPADAATDDGTGTGAESEADGGAGGTEDAAAGGEQPVETAPDQGPAVCGAADLTLVLAADARTYPAGVQPTFTVSLTNAGAVACTVDADAAQREVLITSGSDRIWSSLDCPPAPAPNLLLLEPGARTDAALVWERVRSATGCPAELPEPRAGTYTAVVTMLGVTSAPVVLELG